MRTTINIVGTDRTTWGDVYVGTGDTVERDPREVRVSIGINLMTRGIVSGLLTVAHARELAYALEAAARAAEDEQERLEKK